jgi:hypothetical protein
MKRLLLLGMTLFVGSPALAQELHCEIKSKFVCQASGCQPVAPNVWNVIDPSLRKYSRCDKKGCDVHEALIGHSGAFMTIQVGPNTISKMAEIDQPLAEIKAFSFHEVATQMHAAYVSFGTCKPN